MPNNELRDAHISQIKENAAAAIYQLEVLKLHIDMNTHGGKVNAIMTSMRAITEEAEMLEASSQ